jgi:hypothetical protein
LLFPFILIFVARDFYCTNRPDKLRDPPSKLLKTHPRLFSSNKTNNAHTCLSVIIRSPDFSIVVSVIFRIVYKNIINPDKFVEMSYNSTTHFVNRMHQLYYTVTKRQLYLTLKSNKIYFLKTSIKRIKTGCIVMYSLCTPYILYRSECHKETQSSPFSTHFYNYMSTVRLHLQRMPSDISSVKYPPSADTPTRVISNVKAPVLNNEFTEWLDRARWHKRVNFCAHVFVHRCRSRYMYINVDTHLNLTTDTHKTGRLTCKHGLSASNT